MVSVIIPCYNCEGFVSRAINSILKQSYQDLDIYLVDNNSTDNTLKVIREFESNYPNKIAVLSQEKKGACAARNKGLEMAKGDWIQFLDADDEILPGKIERQVNMVSQTGAELVVGNYLYQITGANGKTRTREYEADADVWKGLITSNLGCTNANFFKKDLLLKINGWNEDLSSSQEYDLMFRLLSAGARILHDKDYLTIVYKLPDSVSQTKDKSKLAQIVENRIELRLKIREFLKKERKLNLELKQRIDYYIFNELKRHAYQIPKYVLSVLMKKNPGLPYKYLSVIYFRLLKALTGIQRQ